jgi:hypothetical protein
MNDVQLEKPDDVSLDDVHEEMKRFEISNHRKGDETISSVLKEIKSSLGLLHGRFNQLENRLTKIEDQVSRSLGGELKPKPDLVTT